MGCQGAWGHAPASWQHFCNRGALSSVDSVDRTAGSALCHICQVPPCHPLPAVGTAGVSCWKLQPGWVTLLLSSVQQMGVWGGGWQGAAGSWGQRLCPRAWLQCFWLALTTSWFLCSPPQPQRGSPCPDPAAVAPGGPCCGQRWAVPAPGHRHQLCPQRGSAPKPEQALKWPRLFLLLPSQGTSWLLSVGPWCFPRVSVTRPLGKTLSQERVPATPCLRAGGGSRMQLEQPTGSFHSCSWIKRSRWPRTAAPQRRLGGGWLLALGRRGREGWFLPDSPRAVCLPWAPQRHPRAAGALAAACAGSTFTLNTVCATERSPNHGRVQGQTSGTSENRLKQ